MGMTTVPGDWKPIGWAKFTSLSSAVTLATATPAAGTAYASLTTDFGRSVRPSKAIITVEGAAVRYHDNGDTPTAAVGTPILQNGSLVIDGSPDVIRLFKVIEQAASASMHVRYYQ